MSRREEPRRRGADDAVVQRTARNVVVSAGAQVVGKVATLAWTVLAARVLGVDDFGVFFFGLTLSLLLGSASQWGFEAHMTSEGSREPARLPRLFAQAVSWQVSVATPLLVAAAIAVTLLRPDGDARLVLWLLLSAMLPEIYSEACRAGAAASQAQAGTSAALVLQRGATAGLVVAALLLGTGVVGAAAAYLLGTLVGAAAHRRAAAQLGLTWSPAALRGSAPGRALRETWVLGLTTLSLMALFRIDAVLLGVMADDDAVGSYAAAYRLLETVLFVAFALRAALFPLMNAQGGGVEAPRRGIEVGVTAIGLVYLPFAVVALVETEAVLGLLYGEPYGTTSAAALQWLALAPLAYGLAYLQSAALLARRRLDAMLGLAVGSVVVNVGLNLLLIPAYEGAGAALATTTSYALVGVVGVVLLRRDGVRARLLRPLAEAALAAGVLAALLLVLRLDVLLEVPLGAVVFLAVWGAASRRWSPDSLSVVRDLVRRRA